MMPWKRIGETEWHAGEDGPPEYIAEQRRLEQQQAEPEPHAPNPYEPDLTKLRAASETTFEDEYKAARLSELRREIDRFETFVAENPLPRVRDDGAYAPPDPYARLLRRLREEEG